MTPEEQKIYDWLISNYPRKKETAYLHFSHRKVAQIIVEYIAINKATHPSF